MMPTCEYKRCKRVADDDIGELKYPAAGKDGYGRVWTQPAYLCKKHIKKIRKLLRIEELKEKGKNKSL